MNEEQTIQRRTEVLSQSFILFLSFSDFAISRFKKLSAGHIKNAYRFQRQPLSEGCDLVRCVFYVRYAVSYRDLEEIMAERGVQIDHATLNRWVVKYSDDIAKRAQIKKSPTAGSWRMDETYIKVKGPSRQIALQSPAGNEWMYLYRAIDTNGLPSRIVIDKSGANLAGLQRINIDLKFSRSKQRIEIFRVKYLNNIVKQVHRFIKKITRPTLGFKAFHSAAATLAGIKVAHMIRKQQFQSNHTSPFKQFASLAA